MKKFIFSIATLFLLGILVTSCQKDFEESNPASNEIGIEHSLKKGSELSRLEVGKTLNRLINSKNVNQMLLSSIGDDELPLIHLKDQKGGRSTLGELMDATTTSTEAVLTSDPLLNLFIFYPNDEKDFNNPITKVAVVNDRKGESEVLLLDRRGNPTIMGDEEDLGEVTLVLKSNESLVALNPRTLSDSEGNDYTHLKDMIRFISPISTTPQHEIFTKGDIEDLENVYRMKPFEFDDEDPWDLFCKNGIQDFWEDGVDCGGPFCPPCQNEATCNDGVQNGWETGIDCGGPFCEPCEIYTGLCGYEADRDVNASKDYLHKFKLADCATYNTIKEFLLEGKYFEFRIDVIFADQNGEVANVLKTKSIHKNDVRNKNWIGSCTSTKWYDFSPDLDIVTWLPETYGSAMKYIWTEEDTGAEISIPFTIKTKFKIPGVAEFEVNAGITLKFTDKDDLLGEAVVEYCDNTEGEGTVYNTGDVAFYVRQH